MKFATKLSLGCITLLSCALCAAGLILTGKSFSGSLETTRAAMQAQQAKEKYTLERCIFTAAETNTLFSTNPTSLAPWKLSVVYLIIYLHSL